jgi:hypothetical protein
MRLRRQRYGWALICCVLATAVRAAESPTGGPATVAEAAKLLDLTTFPLAEGALRPQYRNVAGLSYMATGAVKPVFEFQQKQLTERSWKDLPNSYVTEQAASATFGRDGYLLSLSVYPAGKAGSVNVMLINHGNVELGKLPIPRGAKPLYSGPVNAAYITEAPAAATAEACRKLLLADGWQPYGTAGDSLCFKQNAVRLTARAAAAPAQGGKTVIQYSAVLMSADLPAPAETEQLQYADMTTELRFDTRAKLADVAGFYRTALAKAAWAATTEQPVRIGFKDLMIFRNPQKDMLTLESYDVDGKNRVSLKWQSAAEIADLERQSEEQAQRQKAIRAAPLPKLVVVLPANAQEVQQTKSRIAFKVAAGKALAIVESWRRQFGQDGWKAGAATLHPMAGSLAFTKGDLSLIVMYSDSGYSPADITIHASGAELERAMQRPQ